MNTDTTERERDLMLLKHQLASSGLDHNRFRKLIESLWDQGFTEEARNAFENILDWLSLLDESEDAGEQATDYESAEVEFLCLGRPTKISFLYHYEREGNKLYVVQYNGRHTAMELLHEDYPSDKWDAFMRIRDIKPSAHPPGIHIICIANYPNAPYYRARKIDSGPIYREI